METKLESLFARCDPQGKGTIGREELSSLCATLGISSGDADAIFNDLDHDGDGAINLSDFSHGFNDFLTPGSRRGSLQLPLVDVSRLEEMERRHNSAKKAWSAFTHRIGFQRPSLGDIVEEERRVSGDKKLLSNLMQDVQKLHEEYRNLESTFKKEREAHSQQLAALGEELDAQLAKSEARAKAEARAEAASQMERERRKIVVEMEGQLSEVAEQLRTFKKVEEWLLEQEQRSSAPGGGVKLAEAEEENRTLRNALIQAQSKATLLQTELTHKRNEYVDLCSQLEGEKAASSQYREQVDLMHQHLSILNEANRVLCDANDVLNDQDKDSGRETLQEELRGLDSSPLPSGIWLPPPSSSPSPPTLLLERTFKVILAGDAAVGKSSFIERVVCGHFSPNLSSTIGVDFRVKSFTFGSGPPVVLQLWDTAGQERFRSLTKNYFRRGDGVLLMYDVTNESSFTSIRNWIHNVEEGAGRRLPVVLCANKIDLPPVVKGEDGQRLADQTGAIFVQTSPKTGEGVEKALELLAREMSLNEDEELKESLRLGTAVGQDMKKKGCCG